MAIAYKSQGAAVATATSGAALSPLTPAVVDANDILIAHVWYRDTTTTPSTPSGWTLLSGPHTLVASRSFVYGRIAAASDDAVAAAFGTAGGTVLRMAQIFSYSGWTSGVITDNVFDFVFGEAATAAITDVDRTLNAGEMGVNLVAIEDDLPAPSFSATTGGTGTWTENVAETVSSLGSDGTIGIQTCTATASGNTFTRGAADNWGIVGLTIRPAPPSATNLVVQDAAVALAADNVALVPNLIVQDAGLALAADNVVLVPNLIVQDAAIAVLADNIVLTGVPVDLVLNDASLTLLADNVLLVPDLVVADATLALAVDNVVLVPNLIVADAAIALAADNLILEITGGSAGLDASGTLTLTRIPQLVPLDAFSWDSDGDIGDHLEIDFSISKSTRDTLKGRIIARIDLDGVELSRHGYLWPHLQEGEVWSSPTTMATRDWVAVAAPGAHTIEVYAWIDGLTEPTGVTIDVSVRVIDHAS